MCTIEVLLAVTALMRGSVYRRGFYVLLQPLFWKPVPTSSNTISRFRCRFWYLHKKLLDSVLRYIERERERVRPAVLGRHKIFQCFGPSSTLNTNSERYIDFSIYSRNENLCFISFPYQRGSFYAARPYMRVVIVRWQVVILVFPENLPRPGSILPLLPSLKICEVKWMGGTWWASICELIKG